MADTILQGTLATGTPTPPKGLTVPDSTGNNKTDINTLKGAQNQPSSMVGFQDVLRRSSQEAYNQRQSSELGSLGFDPSKVSGNLFASVIGRLEANRGKDISSIYKTTMSTYMQVQDTITERLQYLETLEEDKRRWEKEMELKEKELKELKKSNERQYKMEKEEFEMSKKTWQLDYNKKKKEANQSSAVSYNDYFKGLADEYFGKSNNSGSSFSPDNYINNSGSSGLYGGTNRLSTGNIG
jgi:hypothetical protein